MKRFLACSLLLVLLGAGAVPAAVNAAPHTARGSGKDSQGGEFRFRAEGPPSQATGTASFTWGAGGLLSGSVDCLWVAGRRAVLSGVLDPQPPSSPYFRIMVKDNSERRRSSPDLFYVQRGSLPLPCADAYVDISKLRIRRGDIKVD